MTPGGTIAAWATVLDVLHKSDRRDLQENNGARVLMPSDKGLGTLYDTKMASVSESGKNARWRRISGKTKLDCRGFCLFFNNSTEVHLDGTLTKVPTHGTCKKNGWNGFLECSGVAVAPELEIMTSSRLEIWSSCELLGL
jgi:hypothetical protein